MADYTDQLVVYSAGSIKKIGDTETVEIHGIELTSSATIPEGGLTLGSTAVNSTAAELNILDGVTATTSEINALAGSTSANSTAGKVAIIGTNGDLTVAGDLTVSGTTTTVNSTTLTVDDKNIELGSVATPTDTTADGGGITLKGATDKTFSWVDSTDSWTSSEHLDLASAKELHIAGTSVLSSTTLGSGVVSSSLTSVGTLTSLAVDNIRVDGSTIGHSDDTDLLTLANGVVTVAGELSVTTLDIGGTDVTSTAAELNILDGVTATTAELNILDGVVATATELNLLDATAGSSLALASGDGLIINDASDSNATKKVLIGDLTSFFASSGSTTADNITAGASAVEITTTSGDVVVDAPSGQSVDLQVAGTNVIEVASNEVTVSQKLVLDASAGITLPVSSSNLAIASGDIISLSIGGGASAGADLADADGGTDTVQIPAGVALAAVNSGTGGNLDCHTIAGAKITINLAGTESIDLGAPVYLSTTAGKATGSVPTAGYVYELGISLEVVSSATTASVLWRPQFIADLG